MQLSGTPFEMKIEAPLVDAQQALDVLKIIQTAYHSIERRFKLDELYAGPDYIDNLALSYVPNAGRLHGILRIS